MAAFLNACRFNPAAGGTTDWTYSSPVSGYQSPVAAGAVNGRIYKYRAESADLSQWELGEGAYNSGTGVFARTTVLYNSSGTGTGTGQSGAGSRISFSAAPQVAIVALREDLVSIEEANAFTATQQAMGRSNLIAAPFEAMKDNNLIINMACEVCQTFPITASFPLATSGVELLSADCWSIMYSGTSTAIQTGVGDFASIGPGPLGFRNYLMLTATGALTSPVNGDYALLRHKIEGYRIDHLNFGTPTALTLAFGVWVYGAATTGTAFIKFSNSAKTRNYYFEFSIPVANTWTFVTGVIPGDTSVSTTNWLLTNGLGMTIEFFCAGKEASPVAPSVWTATNAVQTTNSTANLINGSGKGLYLTGLWVSPGTQAPGQTGFSGLRRSRGEELTLCQRYYEKSFDSGVTPVQAAGSPTNGALAWAQPVGASTAAIVGSVRYAVRKRAVPTLTFYNPVLANGQARNTAAGVDYSATAAFGSGDGGFSLSATSGAATSVGQTSSVNWVADARL
jgi:hypothetical protein